MDKPTDRISKQYHKTEFSHFWLSININEMKALLTGKPSLSSVNTRSPNPKYWLKEKKMMVRCLRSATLQSHNTLKKKVMHATVLFNN